MDSVLIDLGFIQIRWYSFLILIALIIGYFLVLKETKKRNISKDELNDLLFYLIIISILGARVYYVLFNLKYYLQNPAEIIMMWHGGLAIHPTPQFKSINSSALSFLYIVQLSHPYMTTGKTIALT